MNVAILTVRRAHSVLLLDDHSLSRHGAAAALGQANPGWNIATASSLPEFLRCTGLAIWDLLLLDLPTLGAGAEELLQMFRRGCPNSKMVVLNGPEDDAEKRRLVAAGTDGYLSRSAPIEDLSRLATSLLAMPVLDSSIGVSSREPGDRGAGPTLPRAESPHCPPPLTDRQRAVLRLMAEGRSTKDIARRLGLAVGTVKVHLSGTYRALGAHSRVEALAKAGMIELLGP